MFQKLCRFLLILCAAPLTHMVVAADDPVKLPAAGTYQIDPVHSFVYFSAWHQIVGVVRGRFDKITGTVTASPDPAACAVDITIATYSISGITKVTPMSFVFKGMFPDTQPGRPARAAFHLPT